MASFSIPLTGLNADSTELNTIANNLANMNTTAFKSQSTKFADLFYQEVGSTGSGNPIQVGAGVKVASNSTNYTQGSINSTGNATDVALDGNGFFVAAHGNDQELTRAGRLISTAGLRPTAEGVRVRQRGGKQSTTDGPFTETKEVIGGYAILEAASKQEAVELTRRFLKVHGDEWDIECEVRQLEGPESGGEA